MKSENMTQDVNKDKSKSLTEQIWNGVHKTILSLLISFFLTSVIACLLALIPSNQENTKLPKRLLIEKINTEISKIKADKSNIDYSVSLKQIVSKTIEDNYIVKEEQLVKKTGNNFDFVFGYIYKEFNWYLFIFLFLIILIYSGSITWKDYLPVTAEIKESGIHAKLNYQVIADRLSRKLAILMVAIIIFSIGFIFTIFKFSSEIDSIIHGDDIEAYETWINSIEFHVGKNNPTFTNTEGYYKLIETNTELFWKVYFIRFIIVRSFIALIVGSLITFLIRLYRRLRDDRELIIQKEEALSAIHYIARGEWRFRYDSLGKLLFKGTDNTGTNIIINEDEYNVLKADEKLLFNPLKLEILEDLDAKIETRELLAMIPIRELFRSSGESKNASNELIMSLENSAQQLSQIKNDLKSLIYKRENN